MNRRWPLWLAAALGLVFGVIAWAPAALVASAVARASGQHLFLADPQGSWRDGSAALVLAGGPGADRATLIPGRLAWRVDLARLWRGDVGLALLPSGGTALHLALGLGPGGWTARQSAPTAWSLRLPAQVLQGLGAPWNTIAPSGVLTLTLRGATLRHDAGRTRMEGGAELLASDMSSRLSQIAPLGDYRIAITGSGDGASFAVSTPEGPLRITGSGGWSSGRVHFQGQASAAPDEQQGLAVLLGLIGQPEGDHVRIAI